MRNVVVVAAARTAIGTINGQFKSVLPVDLTVPVMKALFERSGVEGIEGMIEEVIWGENYQRTYKENNIGRVCAVKAGCPVTTAPGITIHRNCTSSLSSVQFGYYQIKSGEAECVLAGGTESMTAAPFMTFDMRAGKKFGHSELRDSMWDSLSAAGVGCSMGMTAENVSERYGITREMQDDLAYNSQMRATAAIKEGKFKDEIVPIYVKQRKGDPICVDTDEYPKPNTTPEGLAKLRASFKDGGTVTAGNASGMNDAASGVILMSEEKAKELGAPILCRVAGVFVAGVDPDYMGIGPMFAIPEACKRAGIEVKDLDLVELNEAFAAQAYACIRELGLSRDIVNVNGSGISLGHPVGATGTRMITTLIYEAKRRGNVHWGCASACAGTGMGVAIVFEF
ncbi:MAG: thiolase family protein [Firmicutes bacterium]|nr:thiolase family protein [Bacillota bacterium]